MGCMLFLDLSGVALEIAWLDGLPIVRIRSLAGFLEEFSYFIVECIVEVSRNVVIVEVLFDC
jgi:hypothetical protein